MARFRVCSSACILKEQTDIPTGNFQRFSQPSAELTSPVMEPNLKCGGQWVRELIAVGPYMGLRGDHLGRLSQIVHAKISGFDDGHHLLNFVKEICEKYMIESWHDFQGSLDSVTVVVVGRLAKTRANQVVVCVPLLVERLLAQPCFCDESSGRLSVRCPLLYALKRIVTHFRMSSHEDWMDDLWGSCVTFAENCPDVLLCDIVRIFGCLAEWLFESSRDADTAFLIGLLRRLSKSVEMNRASGHLLGCLKVLLTHGIVWRGSVELIDYVMMQWLIESTRFRILDIVACLQAIGCKEVEWLASSHFLEQFLRTQCDMHSWPYEHYTSLLCLVQFMLTSHFSEIANWIIDVGFDCLRSSVRLL